MWQTCYIANNFPILEIKNFIQFNTLDDILMCGYPGGEYTFSIEPSHGLGRRFSPLLQQGKISAIIPVDGDKTRDGFITDIISTSGSSGSPIADIEGTIIGVVCSFIPFPVIQGSKQLPSAIAQLDIVYAVGNNKFSHCVKSAMEYFDTGEQNPAKVAARLLKFNENLSK
jgi:hypothetical protein